MVGTGEDEHRILDFIHQTLEAGTRRNPSASRNSPRIWTPTGSNERRN